MKYLFSKLEKLMFFVIYFAFRTNPHLAFAATFSALEETGDEMVDKKAYMEKLGAMAIQSSEIADQIFIDRTTTLHITAEKRTNQIWTFSLQGFFQEQFNRWVVRPFSLGLRNAAQRLSNLGDRLNPQ